jgi:hypothetical protein
MASELAWKKSEEAVGSPNYELRGSDNHIKRGQKWPRFFYVQTIDCLKTNKLPNAAYGACQKASSVYSVCYYLIC